MTELHKSRRGVYQMRDNRPQYIQEVFEIRNLPALGRNVSDSEIIQIALGVSAANPTGAQLPQPGQFKDGLPQSGMVVEKKMSSGNQRRIIVTWGRRGRGTLVTASRQFRMIGPQDIVQPFTVLEFGEGTANAIYSTQWRTIERVRFVKRLGQFVDPSTNTENDINTLAASNYNKLYKIDGQAALLVGVETIRRQSNELWCWTNFMTTGWVRNVNENVIVPGQRPIVALPPLHEYGQTRLEGTPVRDILETYDTGDTLDWGMYLGYTE